MKKIYTVKTIAQYEDIVEVEAESEDEALRLANENAEYEYSCWYDAWVVSEVVV